MAIPPDPRTSNPLKGPKTRTAPRQLRPQVEEHHLRDDLIGGGMVLAAVLVFLSLFSYDIHDGPAWLPGYPSDSVNEAPVNFIGTTGAVIAYGAFLVMGLATYALPFSLTWFGVCKVISHARISVRHWLGVMFVLLAGAALLDVTGWGSSAMGNGSPWGGGGAVGHFLGGKLALNLFGPVGSVIVLALFYSTGLIFVSGMHPSQVIASARQEIPIFLAWLWQQLKSRPAPVVEEPAAEEALAKVRKGRNKNGNLSSVGCSTATEPPPRNSLPRRTCL